MAADARYIVHAISNSASRQRGTGWIRSAGYATHAEAWREVKRLADAGQITLAFVVRHGPGREVEVLPHVWPESARRVLRHHQELLKMLGLS